MSYTFDSSISTDLAKVRFHVGDTNESGAYLQDETITALLTSEGSVGGAVLACIKYIITQLSRPDFRLDWMSVTNAEAKKGFEDLLKMKAADFGISLASSNMTMKTVIGLPHRADSKENNDGVYSNEANYLGGYGATE